MKSREAVVVAAVRTPIGAFNGSLKTVSATDLGAIAIREACARIGLDPRAVDLVVMGNVLQAGLGQNPARQAALKAGLSEAAVAGGMESMSRAPYLLEGVREGYRFGDRQAVDSMIRDGLWCAFIDRHVGITAENVGDKYGIAREEQDEFALGSQSKWAAAAASGKFREEMAPVAVAANKGEPLIMDRDEHPRPGTTLEQLRKLKPAFKPDGAVTAGNASGINDGAACMIVMSRARANEWGLTPLGTVRANASTGVEPGLMGIGPVSAVNRALARGGIDRGQIDLFEINEAFAAQSLAVINELGVSPDKVNVNGGSIALGHPIGASGARIMVTLLHEMNRRDARLGMAALCVGGGQGIATLISRD